MGETRQTLIRAVYRSRHELEAALLSDLPHGGLFVPLRTPPDLMTPVTLELRLPQLEAGLFVQGLVTSRRLDRGRSALRPGAGIHFLAAEAQKRAFVEAVAGGKVVDLAHRRHTRIPVRVQVQWSDASSRTRSTSLIDDISEGGAFIRTRRFRRPGTKVVLEFTGLGREAATVVEAMVTRTCHTVGEEGIGVQFIERGFSAIELRELIRLLVQRTYGEALVAG